MKIGIVDADLIGRSKHRFPNLACMKISGYHKSLGDTVTLITEYLTGNAFQRYYSRYDKIYVSKVFVDTPVPYDILNLSITQYDGTGFFFANSQPLIYEIEHHMPDYHLYDDWIKERKAEGKLDRDFIYYEQYSIGFTSRKCVRQCKFCINQHSTKVEDGSPVSEFLDETRPYICLLDDNILAYENWKEVFKELNSTGKMFEYKQGFDIRALNDEKAQVLMDSNFNKNFLYFAFDNIKDRNIIEEKLQLWKRYYKKHINMYLLCGFDENNIYNEDFWIKDVESLLERIRICIEYGVYPYIMKYRICNISPSPFRGIFIDIGSWCNQKSMFVKLSLNEWANKIQKANEIQLGKQELFSSKRYLFEFAGQFPDIAYKYFDMKFDQDTKQQYAYEKEEKNKTIPLLDKIDTNIEKAPEIELIKKTNVKVKNKTIECKKKEQNQILNKDISTIFNYFKYPSETFVKGIGVKFNGKGVKSIPLNSINLMLINCKNEVLNESEKSLLIASEEYLKKDSNLYIYNTDLKSFTFAKEIIEQNTNLKFKEVTTSMSFDKAKTRYCSRYTFQDKSKIFNKDLTYTRVSLLQNIIKQTTKKNDNVLAFFEGHNYFERIGEDYYKINWICFKKRMIKDTESASKFLKQIISNKQKNTQITISETQDKDIG